MLKKKKKVNLEHGAVLWQYGECFIWDGHLLLEATNVQKVQHQLIGIMDNGASALVFSSINVGCSQASSNAPIFKHGDLNIAVILGQKIGSRGSSNSWSLWSSFDAEHLASVTSSDYTDFQACWYYLSTLDQQDQCFHSHRSSENL